MTSDVISSRVPVRYEEAVRAGRTVRGCRPSNKSRGGRNGPGLGDMVDHYDRVAEVPFGAGGLTLHPADLEFLARVRAGRSAPVIITTEGE